MSGNIITISVNGKKYELAKGATLADFMLNNGVDAGKTVAAVNGEIVKRDSVTTCKLSDGDKVELMTFAGGG